MLFSQKLVLGAMVSAVVACGPGLKGISDMTGGQKDADSPSETETVPVSVSVQEHRKPDASLGLADDGMNLMSDATAFGITVSGCATGFTGTASEATLAGLSVYKFDRNCIAKLTQFSFNGSSYIPLTDFATWQPGDTATFKSTTNASDLLSVAVASQLNNPIAGSEDVSYTYSQVSAGADKNIASSVVGAAHILKVSGQGAPAFQVKSVSFSGVTALGAGQFSFVMECLVAVTGSGVTESCKDAVLPDISYKLVKDTYSGAPTLANLNDMFVSGSSTIAIPSEVLALGSGSAANGGFSSKVLDGPGAMHNNPQMLLALKVGVSYQYFNVDVTTLSTAQ